MTSLPPSPFMADTLAMEPAAATSSPAPLDAAAGPIAASAVADDIWALLDSYPMNDCRFVLDEDRFLADIEQPPAFLADPRPEFLAITEVFREFL